jgi:hypothetical protein
MLQKDHAKVIGEPLQAGLVSGAVIASMAINLDCLETFINYFIDYASQHNVDIIFNNNKLSFRFLENIPLEQKQVIVGTLERTDSLILSKLGKIDNLVEQSINVEGELLDDLDS